MNLDIAQYKNDLKDHIESELTAMENEYDKVVEELEDKVSVLERDLEDANAECIELQETIDDLENE